MSTRTVRRLASYALLAAALGFAVLVATWVLTGGHWFVVETPSMGTSAPVGTLLWVRPVGSAASLHVGDFITFHPPGSAATYSHRILAILPDGTIRTKGEITGADPWRITVHDVVGRVAMRWWDVGWLIKAAPILLLGALALVPLATVVGRVAGSRWRLPTVMVGSSIVLSVVMVVVRPLTGAVQLPTAPGSQVARAAFVSTGVLPLQVDAGGPAAVVRAGEVARVVAGPAGTDGRYAVHLSPAIPWWFWAVIVLASFLPAIWTTIRPASGRSADDAGSRPHSHRAVPAAA
ncbi:MAG: S24/S26 family peptidase [Williamsia herbipolensis]|nr:S24/S26 family peptidase [Williamsia herbipolensis]